MFKVFTVVIFSYILNISCTHTKSIINTSLHKKKEIDAFADAIYYAPLEGHNTGHNLNF